MKNRKSKVTHEHQQVLEELKNRKTILAHKFASKPTKNIKKKECLKVSEPQTVPKNIDNNKHKWSKNSVAENIQCIKVPEPQPVQRNNINKLQWLEERAAENVRQWGVRAKVDVAQIQALAAKLKYETERNQPEPAKRIRSRQLTATGAERL